MTGSGTIPIKMEFVARTQNSEPARPIVVPFPSDVLAITRGLAEGNEDAARQFLARYGDRLFRYLLVVTRGREDEAREILSVTMIKAVRSIRAMRSDADVWRWLTRVALNAFIDERRKGQRHRAADPLPETLPAPDADRSLAEAMDQCVLALPPEERAMIERYYFENESQSALAETAQTSRKAIESRLARIRQKLRAAILKRLS